MRSEHQCFVEASGQLARTGCCTVLGKDLQPEFAEHDERPAPLDAPTFTPTGATVKYDDQPLQGLGLVERRLV